MAVFYKYEYTNKRKNIHPCDKDKVKVKDKSKTNPPLDTIDQLPSDIISATETKIKINLRPKKCKTNPLLDTTDQLILDIISAIIQIKTDVKPNTTIKITNLTNYPQMSET